MFPVLFIYLIMNKNDIYRIYGTSYKEMTLKLLEASDLNSQIRDSACRKNRQQKRPEDLQIVIKPNLVSPTPADFGATTHPQIVEGIIDSLEAKNRLEDFR